MTGPSNGSLDGKTQVLQAIDIVELIGQTVKLKRRGRNFVGLCPFHSEKTPSFTVDPVKRYFRCYGCKESGNAIDFVIKRDRLEFVEALTQLARQAGVELPRFSVSKQDMSERQVLLEAHSAACGLFEKLLSHPQIGAAAREYLEGRGFNAQTLKQFQVGFVPDGWDNLLRSQAMKKFPPEQLAAGGLLKTRESGGGFYDTFRNRIMFPIRDEQGRIIAFGGRVMPGSADPAKYLNSPETPLFSKGRCVFGLSLARQRIVETQTAAVVEGYTDVVMAHQYGATNVVSVLGTAMTPQHVSILRRFANRIVLLFDADTAGDLAVNRAVELFLTQPVEIAIASMPDGVDPDEFIMANGLEVFEKMLAEAQDALAYKWRQLLREFGSSGDLTSQQRAVEQYLELLASARGTGPVDPLRWGAVLTRVSRLTEIPAEELNRRFRMRRKPAQRPIATTVASAPPAAEPDSVVGAGSDDAPSPRRQRTAQDIAERWLLGVLLAQPARWQVVQQSVGPVDFTDPLRRKLAEVYWTHQRDEGEPVFNELLGLFGEDVGLKELAISLLEEVEASAADTGQTLADALEHMNRSQRRQDELKLMAELRRNNETPRSAEDEVELLRKLQERARQPDIRRASS